MMAVEDDDPEGVFVPFDPVDFCKNCWGEIKEEKKDDEDNEEEEEDDKEEESDAREVVTDYYHFVSAKRTLRMYEELAKDERKWQAAPEDVKEKLEAIREFVTSCPPGCPAFRGDLQEFSLIPAFGNSRPYLDLLPKRDSDTGHVLVVAPKPFVVVSWLGNETQDEYYVKLYGELRSYVEMLPAKSFVTEAGRDGIIKEMVRIGKQYLGKISTYNIKRALDIIRYYWSVKLAEHRCHVKKALWSLYAQGASKSSVKVPRQKLSEIESSLLFFWHVESEAWRDLPEEVTSDPKKQAEIVEAELQETKQTIGTYAGFQKTSYIERKMKLAKVLGIWGAESYTELHKKLSDAGKLKCLGEGPISSVEEPETNEVPDDAVRID